MPFAMKTCIKMMEISQVVQVALLVQNQGALTRMLIFLLVKSALVVLPLAARGQDRFRVVQLEHIVPYEAHDEGEVLQTPSKGHSRTNIALLEKIMLLKYRMVRKQIASGV